MLFAGNWPEILPSTWAIREDPAKGIKGALVLENRMRFSRAGIEHVYRVRILSEAGRSAATFMNFLPEAKDIDGRTVQRNGTIVTFNKLKDFQTKTLADENRQTTRQGLVPPGISSDCLVEVRWTDSVNAQDGYQLPRSLGFSAVWNMDSPFMVQEEAIEVDSSFNWDVFVTHGRATQPEVTKEGGTRIFTFHNLPGRESAPYSLVALAGRPRVAVWLRPGKFQKTAMGSPASFWQEAITKQYRPYYSDFISKGSAYKKLRGELLSGLPQDPLAAAPALLRKLDRRIRNISQPTVAEATSMDLKAIRTQSNRDPRNLETIVTQGAAPANGMDLLFLNLLQDAGIKPLLAFTSNREVHPFNYELQNVHQATHLLIGVQNAKGDRIWLDPALRYADPGLILPEFQGFDALVVDTADWKPRKETLPVQPARYNATMFLYQINFQEDAEHFKAFASFSGSPEFATRRRFMEKAPLDQDRAMKEALESRLPNASIRFAKVKGATDPDVNVSWEAEGTLEATGTSQINLAPFPGMPAPLAFPRVWPERRVEPIVLPILEVESAQSVVTLPKGYRCTNQAPFIHENSFGKVTFRVDPDPKDPTGAVTAQFMVETRRLVAPAEAYDEFRTFMRWAEEAFHAKVSLEKQP